MKNKCKGQKSSITSRTPAEDQHRPTQTPQNQTEWQKSRSRNIRNREAITHLLVQKEQTLMLQDFFPEKDGTIFRSSGSSGFDSWASFSFSTIRTPLACPRPCSYRATRQIDTNIITPHSNDYYGFSRVKQQLSAQHLYLVLVTCLRRVTLFLSLPDRRCFPRSQQNITM